MASAGYDDESQTLEVEFHSGGIYQYFDVPQATYEQLRDNPSPGTFFGNQIRGVFRYART